MRPRILYNNMPSRNLGWTVGRSKIEGKEMRRKVQRIQESKNSDTLEKLKDIKEFR